MCQLKRLIQTARTESTSWNCWKALWREKPTRIARQWLERRKERPTRITFDGGWNGEIFTNTDHYWSGWNERYSANTYNILCGWNEVEVN